jgi:hypothetical protein
MTTFLAVCAGLGLAAACGLRVFLPLFIVAIGVKAEMISVGSSFEWLGSSAATLDATTTAYTSSDEVANSGTYAAGGGTLTNVTPTTSGTTAFTDFDDISFTSATINARGALIYNSTPTHTYTNPSVAVLDFGGDKISTAGTFTIQFPAADASNAIIRIS